jgi:hypothetical protein
MSKISSGSRTAKANNMANLSAIILREIVARTFDIKATTVVLSGEISPSMSWESNSCWSSQTTETGFSVFSFSAKSGFVPLDVVSETHNNQDGHASISEAKYNSLASALETECPESIFVIVFEDCRAYDDNQSFSSVTLYKAPNWREYLQKITAEDILRWEKWLEE